MKVKPKPKVTLEKKSWNFWLEAYFWRYLFLEFLEFLEFLDFFFLRYLFFPQLNFVGILNYLVVFFPNYMGILNNYKDAYSPIMSPRFRTVEKADVSKQKQTKTQGFRRTRDLHLGNQSRSRMEEAGCIWLIFFWEMLGKYTIHVVKL